MSLHTNLIGHHLWGLFDVLGDDSRARQAHEERNEEETEEHDEDQQELALVQSVQPGKTTNY